MLPTCVSDNSQIIQKSFRLAVEANVKRKFITLILVILDNLVTLGICLLLYTSLS